jgi:hypothetical protein
MGLTVAARTPVAAAGLAAWRLIGPGTGYFTVLLPGLVVMSFGQDPRVHRDDGGRPHRRRAGPPRVAGAINITAQQIGSGLGTAVLATAAAVGLLGAAAATVLLRTGRTGA